MTAAARAETAPPAGINRHIDRHMEDRFGLSRLWGLLRFRCLPFTHRYRPVRWQELCADGVIGMEARVCQRCRCATKAKKIV
ncbi:MAG: hypothetical protein LBV50_03840 [Novosphingobium sp.]|jgi:hypothetical protein|nr:hypothetical protein [Novosphingobium sp.]